MMQKTFRLENDRLILQSLQMPIVSHCVNNCVACSSFSPISDKKFLDKEIIKRDLINMKKIIDIDIFYLFGGEPLLHPDLIKIIDIVRESGISKKITLLTNGQLLDRISKEFWHKIDRINLTRYPGKINDDKLKEIENKCKDFKIEFEIVKVVFSKTVYHNQNTEEKTQKIFSECFSGGWCLTVCDGWFYLCCQLFYLQKFINRNFKDGILIENLSKENLLEYLTRNKIPEACYFCSGIIDLKQNRSKQIKWEECSNGREWWTRSLADGDQ